MFKVILVDDEELMRKGLLTLIDWTALECEVVSVAENGKRAIEQYEAQAADIVISDIKMPVMDGLALAKYLHDNQKPAKVILLTAFADFAYAKQAIAFGVSEYVTKTGSLDEVVAAVEKCKEQIRREKETLGAGQDKVLSLLQAVLCGTLFHQSEIIQQAAQCKLGLNTFHLFVVDITQSTPISDGEAAQLYRHAQRLIEHELQNESFYFIPVQKSVFCLVWRVLNSCDPVGLCTSFANVFTGVTWRSVFVGICANRHGVLELHEALIQAQSLRAQNFFDRHPVHVFNNDLSTQDTQKYNSSDLFDALDNALHRGVSRECEALTDTLFLRQRLALLTPEEIKEEGVLLLTLCRRAITHAGAQIDELSTSEKEWKNSLLNAQFFDDCCKLQKALVSDTCHTVFDVLNSGTNVVAQAQKYIDAHFREAITLGSIAEAVNVHPSYLSRCFKQRTGDSVVDKITQNRMEYAKKLLREANFKVYEIAIAVGIEDTTYFSHVFHKYTGMSPKVFQKIALQKD